MDAARNVFVENGFDGARMSEIARQAGVGEGTIYSYYESKAELMLAALEKFWDDLTIEAQKVIGTAKARSFFDLMAILAKYHLDAVIRNVGFINLTFALRRNNSEVTVSRDHLRHYVAVFDQLFLRGQDRGELRKDAVLWQARDVFYGSLEYSARSILMTLGSGHHERQQQPVVDQIIAMFRAHYGESAKAGVDEGKTISNLLQKMDILSAKIDRLDANCNNQG